MENADPSALLSLVSFVMHVLGESPSIVAQLKGSLMASQRQRIVVIDDHRIVALGVQTVFSSAEIDVEVVWRPCVTNIVWDKDDVAILDLRLADGSSPEENIARILDYGVPVVVYTSGEDPHLIRRAIASGTLSIVRKSASPSELIEAVRAAQAGETHPNLDWAAAVDADGDFVTEHLSELEAKILSHYAIGSSSASVARQLCLSKHTINTYIARIREKYRLAGRPADSRVDLFQRAAEDGLVSYYNQ